MTCYFISTIIHSSNILLFYCSFLVLVLSALDLSSLFFFHGQYTCFSPFQGFFCCSASFDPPLYYFTFLILVIFSFYERGLGLSWKLSNRVGIGENASPLERREISAVEVVLLIIEPVLAARPLLKGEAWHWFFLFLQINISQGIMVMFESDLKAIERTFVEVYSI